MLKIAEVLLIATLTILVCFWGAVALGCEDLDHDGSSSHSAHPLWMQGKQDRTLCGEGQYSDLATILLEPKEKAIKALFTHSFEGGAVFRTKSLLIGAAIILVMTLLTYGTAIPSGLFVPNILLGACVGRAVGQGVQSMGMDAHPGVYALMGAVGMLAGFSRMTVSLTMITLEITNSMRLLLPVMLVILVSKAMADRLTESVYDIGVMLHPLGNVTVIRGELDDEDMPLLRLLTVHDACSVEVQTLKREECASHIMATLVQTQFSGFPLVSTPENQVIGLILREKLLIALQEHSEDQQLEQNPGQAIDLMPYADETPEVKHWNTPLAKAHRHFTAAGLRHLCVVDETHRLVGILTRSDLAQISHPRGRHQALRALMTRKWVAMHEAHDEDTGQAVGGEDSDAQSQVSSSHVSAAGWMF